MKLPIKFEQSHHFVKWKELKPLQSDTFKKITKTNMEKLKNSIRRNGFIHPLVVWKASDEKLWLLDGVHRVKALTELENEFLKNPNAPDAMEIPEQLPAIFVEADNIQEAAKRVPLMSSQYATVQENGMLDFANTYNLDLELLKEEVSIPDLSLGNLIGDLFINDLQSGKLEEQKVKGKNLLERPALFKNAIFQLGDHIVYSGNSLEETYYNEMLKRSPNVCLTDPPYGVNYDPTWRALHRAKPSVGNQVENPIPNDDRCDWRELWKLFTGNTILSFFAMQKIREVWDAFESSGFQMVRVLIWKKSNFALSRANYHRQYEPIFFANRIGKPIAWTGNLDQSDVFEFASPNSLGGDSEKEAIHSAQKPVELLVRLILNHTKKAEWVYDPFLGSGSTLIACENTERRLIGGDISPEFVEGAIIRWATHIGIENAQRIFRCLTDETITLQNIIQNRKVEHA